ncbi:TonB-dependent vitamin B12 receptor, partial [Pseudomonas aeruginosa]|nr:TonB-dependent vitamin B12 receptor [Pseudomonas aeruginosa]
LGVSSFDTAGLNAKRAGTSSYEPNRDCYRNLSGNPRRGYRFHNGLELDGTLLRAKSHNDDDQGFGNSGLNTNADGGQNLVCLL